MKPFNLEKALSGAKLITRSGEAAVRFQKNRTRGTITLFPNLYPYEAEVQGEVLYFTETGDFIDKRIESSSDLFLDEE